MGSDPWIGRLILLILLVLVNALFACAEIAVISISDTKLEKLEEEGDARARLLRRLTRVPARFLATIQVAITLAGFLSAAFASEKFAGMLARATGMPDAVAIILVTVILSFFTLVFGELVPKRLAMKAPEKVGLALARLLYVISIIFAPLVWLLSTVTNAILRLFGVDPNAEEEEVTEEEIRMMVDAGGERGTIDEDEQEMIQNIFEFDDITAGEICVHRKDVSILWAEESLEEWERTIHVSRHSKFPVCGETADVVLGILDSKDFFRLRGITKKEMMAQAMDEAHFVPGSIKADDLFQNMKKSGNYFAVVLDEYGGMDGIITIRDLIEQIVGDLVEEDEKPEPDDIVQMGDGRFRIQGSTPLDDVAAALGVGLPVDDFESFGGYIFGALGEIPADGTRPEFEADGLRIRVDRVRDHRIVSATAEIMDEPDIKDGDVV